MKSTFADADQETVPTAAAVAQEKIVPAASSAVVPDTFFQNDEVEGDFEASDRKMPYLSLGQMTGDLTNELGFKPGEFVFNKETSLGSEGIEITLVKLRKHYQEWLAHDPSGNGPRPQYFKLADDARKAGMLPIADKWGMGEDAKGHSFFMPVLVADLLIKGKKEFASFPLDFNGTPFAFARWTLQSTGYNRVGKQFYSDSQMALRGGLSTKYYTISAKKEKLGENWVFVPSAKLAGKNTDEFVTWVKDMTT